jgi:hypothetical protein
MSTARSFLRAIDLRFAALLSLFMSTALFSQNICNSSGNLMLFTNYDGGTLNINVNQNITNLKIGICSYEAMIINISGTFSNNITEIRYAGYNSINSTHCGPSIPTTTINGAPTSASTSIVISPTANYSNSNGYGSIICGYSCSNNTNQGGCNTVDQIEAYFLAYFSGSTLFAHRVQYGCWTGTQSVSVGGNCCPVPALLPGNIGTSYTMCVGDTPTAITSNTAATGGLGTITYTWQSSTSSPSSGFSNISGANSTSYTPSSVPVTTYFRRAASTPSNSAVYSNVVTVTVYPLPVVTISGTNTVCAGDAATLTASGGVSYLWSTAANTATVVVTPLSTTTYSVIATSTFGCVNMGTKTVAVNALPLITALSSKPQVCENESLNLVAVGGVSYTWSPGNLIGSVISVTPAASTVYTVTGANSNGCRSSAMLAILVVPVTPVTITPASATVCSGKSVTLTASGPGSYTWMPGNTLSAVLTNTMTAATVYTVLGDDGSCSSSATVQVSVDLSPTVSIVNQKTKICPGESTTLTASGAQSYAWTGSGTFSANTAVVFPLNNSGYSVTGTATNNCTHMSSITITLAVCTGIKERSAEEDITLFPNPNNGDFILSAKAATDIVIFDALGKRMIECALNASNGFTKKITGLSPGVYFVVFGSNGNSLTRKLLVE